MQQVRQPFVQIVDLSGKPLSNGNVYFGISGLNPETNPVVAYWDKNGLQPAVQPIKTENGYFVRDGNVSDIYISENNYSITAKDKNGNLIFYKGSVDNDASSINVSNGGANYSTVQEFADYVKNFLTNLGSSIGSSLVGFLQSGTSAVPRTVQDKAREVVSVFDFMTSAQKADVMANTAASNLAAALDVTAAIQAAINYVATRALVGGAVYFPPGSYKISSTIYSYGSGQVGQVGLIGSGKFATRFFPSGDFTAINIVSSYVDSGEFSVEWPVTASAAIPSSRIAVEFAGANWQGSYLTVRNITVMYAYRGYVLNDWTGQTFGTMYLCKLYGLTSFRCANWGFYLNSKNGSTTLIMELCYARGDSSAGGQYGKGIYINNFNDVQINTPAIDQCLNDWLHVINAVTTTLISVALEANAITSASATPVYLNLSSVSVIGIKTISCTFNTGGIARIVYMGANCYNLNISGYSEQGNTIVAGTTRYKVAFNAVASNLFVSDGSIVPADVLDNGWFVNGTYQGIRKSVIGLAPNYGTWNRGDYVKNGAPSVGQPKGWICTVSGTPGTWVSEGNL